MTGEKPPKVWNVKGEYSSKARHMSDECKISPILAQLLLNRGVTDSKGAETFLKPSLSQLYSPFQLPDMEQAIAVLDHAIKNRGKIVIYGDYDADGVTATALLYESIQELTDQVGFYIPDRFTDGYGLTLSGLKNMMAYNPDVKLVITVDCGINSTTEVDWLQEQGVSVVITDHHEPLVGLPKADAVINPKRKDSEYPFTELAGVGVAFKLLWGYYEYTNNARDFFDIETLFSRVGDLVALGTVCDLVPLVEENRVLVSIGLSLMEGTRRLGLLALLNLLGLENKKLTAGHLGFLIGPRINAAGRLTSGDLSVKLLITNSTEEAGSLANQLDRENKERQQVEKQIVEEAKEMILEHDLLSCGPVIVVQKDHWHEGVLGIVASRLVEAYYRPAIVLTSEHGQAKGSCRSIPGFHMTNALDACETYLEKYGGHEAAAGLSLSMDKVEDFTEAINEIGNGWLSTKDLTPKLDVELTVPCDVLTLKLARELQMLEPFGVGNPQPSLLCSGIELSSLKAVGASGEHLRVVFNQGQDRSINGIWFQGAQQLDEHNVTQGELTEVVFTPKVNSWYGEQLSLDVKALRKIDQRSLDQRIVDLRGQSKETFLEEPRCHQQNSIIVVNTRQKLEALKMGNHDLKVLRVTDSPDIVQGHQADTLMLYDLPYSPHDVRTFIDEFGIHKVYLLYNSHDQSYNWKIWRASIPQVQDVQVAIAHLLNRWPNQRVEQKTLYEDIINDLSLPVTFRWFDQVCRIAEELSILEKTKDEKVVKIHDGDREQNPNEVEEEIKQTKTYQNNQKLQKATLEWERFFLESSAGTLYQVLFGEDISLELFKDSLKL